MNLKGKLVLGDGTKIEFASPKSFPTDTERNLIAKWINLRKLCFRNNIESTINTLKPEVRETAKSIINTAQNEFVKLAYDLYAARLTYSEFQYQRILLRDKFKSDLSIVLDGDKVQKENIDRLKNEKPPSTSDNSLRHETLRRLKDEYEQCLRRLGDIINESSELTRRMVDVMRDQSFLGSLTNGENYNSYKYQISLLEIEQKSQSSMCKSISDQINMTINLHN